MVLLNKIGIIKKITKDRNEGKGMRLSKKTSTMVKISLKGTTKD